MKRKLNLQEKKALSKLADMIEEYLPDSLINLSFAALVWLFGVLVYLPAAAKIDPFGLEIICSLIILLVFSTFLFRGLKTLPKLLESTSTVLAYKWLDIRKKKLTESDVEKTRSWMYQLLNIIVVVIGFMFLSPLLSGINPSINGLAFIIALFFIMWIILARK